MANHGGKRDKAGRKKINDPLIHGSIRLSKFHWEEFKRIGATKWLREYLSSKGKADDRE